MGTTQNAPRDLFRILQVMYMAILAGSIAYTAYSYFSAKLMGIIFINDKTTIQYLWFASLLTTMASIPAAYHFYKKKMESMNETMNLIEKLVFFRSPFLIKLAILEASCFINATFFLMTGNDYTFYATCIVLIVLVINFPSKTAVSNDLKLNAEESEQI